MKKIKNHIFPILTIMFLAMGIYSIITSNFNAGIAATIGYFASGIAMLCRETKDAPEMKE